MVRGQRETFKILKEKYDVNTSYIWVHASSLGEFEQGRPLIELIKQQHPEKKILLTFFSPSGYEVRKNYQHADIVCYLPFDLPGNVNRFLDIINPQIAIFIKYEFWMNYLTSCKKKGISTYIISAIFRPDQIFFRWYGAGYRKVLYSYDKIFVQDKSSFDLLSAYNIKNVVISGDTRFDRVYDVFTQQKSFPLIDLFKNPNVFTLIAGSSWPDDEDILINYFNQHNEIKLIIAPHEIHEEHINNICSKLKRQYIKYSEAAEENIENKDCLIIDCFGMLSSIYKYGNAAYIGGGFGSGIHNTLEAAVYGIPVVFGPNYQRFKEAKDLIAIEGGFSFHNESGFNEIIDRFISDNDFLKKTGEKAEKYIVNNKGVTKNIFNQIFSENLL